MHITQTHKLTHSPIALMEPQAKSWIKVNDSLSQTAVMMGSTACIRDEKHTAGANKPRCTVKKHRALIYKPSL